MDDYSDAFLTEMRERLDAERAELARRQHEAHQDILDVRASDDGIHDTIDTTMLEQTTSTMLRLRDRELTRLREVNLALQRLEQGEYGYCEDTGEPIGQARLRANPLARLSVEAQADREKEEQRRNFRPGLLDDME